MKRFEWIVIAFSMLMLVLYAVLIYFNGTSTWTGIAVVLAIGCVFTILFDSSLKKLVSIAWLIYYCIFSSLGLISTISLVLLGDRANVNYIEMSINITTLLGASYLLFKTSRFKAE